MTLMFSVMTRFAVYPQALGVALIKSLLKPNKPKHLPSSLRGIRLLSSFDQWFGLLVDQRTRRAWQASREQFGFRSETGCTEAVTTLLALIHSRTNKQKRLYVLWIDLRTAFPSLNRSILLLRAFQCGLSLGLCRIILAVFEMASSIVYIGGLIGDSFKETLGTREGAVHSPRLFNIYIDGLRRRIEYEHPNVCQLLHVTIEICRRCGATSRLS